MGSKIPKVATKPDESKSTSSKPKVPQTPSVTPPTPTGPSFPSNIPPVDIDTDFLLATWDGQGTGPVSNSKRTTSEKRSHAFVSPEILAQLDRLSKLKEGRAYDAEEEGVIEQLGRLMEEKIAQVDGGQEDEGMRERIRSLMGEFKGARG